MAWNDGLKEYIRYYNVMPSNSFLRKIQTLIPLIRCHNKIISEQVDVNSAISLANSDPTSLKEEAFSYLVIMDVNNNNALYCARVPESHFKCWENIKGNMCGLTNSGHKIFNFSSNIPVKRVVSGKW